MLFIDIAKHFINYFLLIPEGKHTHQDPSERSCLLFPRCGVCFYVKIVCVFGLFEGGCYVIVIQRIMWRVVIVGLLPPNSRSFTS